MFWRSFRRETRFLVLLGIEATGFLEIGVFWHSFEREPRFQVPKKLQSQEQTKYTELVEE